MASYLAALNSFVRDQEGRVVIIQPPNLPLYLVMGAIVARHLLPAPYTLWMQYVVVATLVLWSLLELASGVSPFRRTLGMSVLVYAVFTLLMRTIN